MKNQRRGIINIILDILFPVLCLECNKYGEYICPNCKKKLEKAKQICPGCREKSEDGTTHKFCKNKTSLDKLHITYKYDGIIKKAIHYFKYKGVKEVAKDLVTETKLEIPTNSLIVPSPISKQRLKERGYNQAEILGRILARNLNSRCRSDILLKHKNTKSQMTLSRKKRTSNLENAFECKNIALLKNTDIIIIDDIYTTGTTMEECAKEIRKHNPKSITGFAIAHGE